MNKPSTIRIVSDGTSVNTQVYTASGEKISGIRSINFKIEANEIGTALLDINVPFVDITAHPLLTIESLEAAAAAYGMKLVK